MFTVSSTVANEIRNLHESLIDSWHQASMGNIVRRTDSVVADAERITRGAHAETLRMEIVRVESAAVALGVTIVPFELPVPTEAERDWFRGRLGMDPLEADGGQDS